LTAPGKCGSIKNREEEKMGLSNVFRAMEFAAHKHRKQTRKDRERTPYIKHPIEVAVFIANIDYSFVYSMDSIETWVVAALLHDTIEDTQTTYEEICAKFGSIIADIVREVSDDKSLPKAVRKQLQIEHASSISLAGGLIKIADKICNVRDIPATDWPVERKLEYIEWAKKVVNALIKRLHVIEENCCGTNAWEYAIKQTLEKTFEDACKTALGEINKTKLGANHV
jgi:guanosine-3',5'-bis(diphosphate) 3'-pyrophosphohydrolase